MKRHRFSASPCLLLIAGALTVACGCGSPPAASDPAAHTADNFLEQKAKETGGDFTKLSPADQKKAQELTQGHGAQALLGTARKLSVQK